jgi:Crp-like helix-turn-helix domain
MDSGDWKMSGCAGYAFRLVDSENDEVCVGETRYFPSKNLPSKDLEASGNRVTLTLTHEEIANMIGTSWETVRGFLASFKRKQHLIEVHGSTVVINDKEALQELVEI